VDAELLVIGFVDSGDLECSDYLAFSETTGGLILLSLVPCAVLEVSGSFWRSSLAASSSGSTGFECSSFIRSASSPL
jgi:hypothetical protein